MTAHDGWSAPARWRRNGRREWGSVVSFHKTSLIEELKARRQMLGWARADVGERCGIDEKFIADWECGRGSPRLEAVAAWVAALGLDLALRPAESEVRSGLQLDWQSRRVTVAGTPVRLTPMEWRALERLARQPGELVSHQELFRHLYGTERHYRAQSTAVRVLITKLRRLLPLRIEARWGQGYVIRGLDPPPPEVALEAADGGGAAAAAAVPRHRHPAPSLSRVVPAAPAVIRLAEHGTRQVPAGLCRAEELGVIERFLAERGATRCPDVATIQQAPLPTLVWDKVKRKWVRPPAPAREAGVRRA